MMVTLKAFPVVDHIRCRIRIRMMEYIPITSRVRMALKRDADEAEGFQSRKAHIVSLVLPMCEFIRVFAPLSVPPKLFQACPAKF